MFEIPEIFFDNSCAPRTEAPTDLYPLQPIGIGQGDCESITSYITRLASEHNLSTRIFMKEVLSKLSNNSFKSINHRSNWDIKYQNGYISSGEMADNICKILEKGTGVSGLENCTIIGLRNIIPINRIFSTVKRHCPLCLNNNDSEDLFERLLWSFLIITACPIHNIKLVESSCNAQASKHLPLFSRPNLAGVCSTCGSIGFRCISDKKQKASAVEIWKAQQISELISNFPLSKKLFSKEKTIEGLNRLIEISTNGNAAAAARKAGINKSSLCEWLKGLHLPGLAQLLNLCITGKVSLTSTLSGEPLEVECPSYQPPPKHKRTRCNKEQLKSELENSLQSMPPKSLTAIAKKLKIDSKTLSYHFPELTKNVTQHYAKFKASQIDAKRKEERDFADGIIRSLIASGRPITNRNFQDAAGKNYLPQSYLYKYLQSVKDQYK